MNTSWRKVLGDFRQHRMQIFLIAGVLTLGTAGVVTAIDAYAVLDREIGRSYRRSNSPDFALWLERMEPRWIDAARRQAGVAEADARRIVNSKVRGRTGEWLPLRLVVVRDFEDQRVGVVHRHGDADWAEAGAGIFVEQSSRALLADGPLRVRTPGAGEAEFRVAGTVHDTSVAPGVMEGIVYAFATPAVAARLGQNAEPDHLVVILENRDAGIAQFASRFANDLRAAGAAPLRTEIYPNVHPHAGLMAALLQIFRGVAAMIFVCSAALAAFMISLWMKREARQIGIMKTIGARSHQIAGQYLALVAPVLAGSVLLAFAIGTQAGRTLIAYTAVEQNIDILRWSVPSELVALELGLGLGVPLLALALPVVFAVRRTAREAIQDPGITAPGGGAGWLRFVSIGENRFVTFALRNAFRRRWRLALTVLGLAAGGATLLTSANHYESLMRVIDATVVNRDHDFEVVFSRALPPEDFLGPLRSVSGIASAEGWRRTAVDLVEPGASTDGEPQRVLLSGAPAGSRLAKPRIQEGRWPEAGETGVVVASRPLLKRNPGLQIGSEIVVQSRDRRTPLKIVGLIDEINLSALYVDAAVGEAVTGVRDLSSELRVKLVPGATLETVVADVDRALLEARLAFSPIVTRRQIRQNYEEHFRNFLGVCAVAALAIAAVGAVCLMAFAGLNVLERAREIGVIRTLGATPRRVLLLFMAESGSVVVLSFALALILAVPATKIFNDFTAQFLLLSVPFEISWAALGALAAGVPLVLAGVWLAVSRQLRLSVRETLAYE